MGYNGQLHEGTFGWQALGNGHRFYSPALMRFHRPDEWSPFERGGINAYAYAALDPINHADPSGQSAWWMAAAFMAAGALAVGAGAVASKLAGNDKAAEVLGAIAGVLTLGAAVVGGQALVERFGLRQGEMQIHRRARKDVVVVHGAKHGTMVGNDDLNGTALAEVLKSKGLGGKPTDLVSCHSGRGPFSQAEVVASATGQNVKAYKGLVFYNPVVKKVLWGSKIRFSPRSGTDAETAAIRNRAMNQHARLRAGQRLAT